METTYLPLTGVAVMAIAFLIRLNPLFAVLLSALATALVSHMSVIGMLEVLGKGFVQTRNLPLIILLPVAVIGLLERHGLREYSEAVVQRIRTGTVGRLLIVYLFLRETTAALGLTSLGGAIQMVRPIIAPMAVKIAGTTRKDLSPAQVSEVRAWAVSADNVGLFFGEDIFVAFGAIALMHTILKAGNVDVDPFHIAICGIPTAVFAFLFHAWRLNTFSARLANESSSKSEPNTAQSLVSGESN